MAASEAALLARARAARELVAGGEDGELLLSYVLWPEAAVLELPPPPTRPHLTRDDVDRIFELREEGLSCSQIAALFGCPKSTITEWSRKGREQALERFDRAA